MTHSQLQTAIWQWWRRRPDSESRLCRLSIWDTASIPKCPFRTVRISRPMVSDGSPSPSRSVPFPRERTLACSFRLPGTPGHLKFSARLIVNEPLLIRTGRSPNRSRRAHLGATDWTAGRKWTDSCNWRLRHSSASCLRPFSIRRRGRLRMSWSEKADYAKYAEYVIELRTEAVPPV